MRALVRPSLFLVVSGAVLAVMGSGCSERPPAPTAPFVAGSEVEAVARVRGFLDAYIAADVDKALSHLCERDPETRAFLERSLAPGSPFRVTSYEVASATPLWERKQPLHLVIVRLPRRTGEPIEHGYRVRAEDGCIERLFGTAAQRRPPPSHPPSHPPSLPPAHPPLPPASELPAPQDPGSPGAADVDEPEGRAGSWGPSLPAAPIKPDDEIIDL